LFDCTRYIGKAVEKLDELQDICESIVLLHPMSSWYCGAARREGDTILVEVWKECSRFMCFEPDKLRGYMVFKLEEKNNKRIIADCFYKEVK
jgi:hypothetical protein